LTERARWWACIRVGRDGATVAEVARELRVGWNTIMRAVREYRAPMVEAPARLEGVSAVGVDEHVGGHTGPYSKTNFVTRIVDITPGPTGSAAGSRCGTDRHQDPHTMVERADTGSTRTSGMNAWRAGCGESRTSGSEGGPGKPTTPKGWQVALVRPLPQTPRPSEVDGTFSGA